MLSDVLAIKQYLVKTSALTKESAFRAVIIIMITVLLLLPPLLLLLIIIIIILIIIIWARWEIHTCIYIIVVILVVVVVVVVVIALGAGPERSLHILIAAARREAQDLGGLFFVRISQTTVSTRWPKPMCTIPAWPSQ